MAVGDAHATNAASEPDEGEVDWDVLDAQADEDAQCRSRAGPRCRPTDRSAVTLPWSSAGRPKNQDAPWAIAVRIRRTVWVQHSHGAGVRAKPVRAQQRLSSLSERDRQSQRLPKPRVF